MTKLRTTSFNTDRYYTEHGQRIAVVQDEHTGWAFFRDYDRYIEGWVKLSLNIGTENHLRDRVMNRYDHGEYDGVPPAALSDIATIRMREMAREQREFESYRTFT